MRKATPLDAALASMTLDQLQCRDFGHAWKPYTARLLGGKVGGYEYTLICSRCSGPDDPTLRHRTMSRTGAVLKSRYAYTDGYLIEGVGRLTGADREQLRLTSILRVLEHAGLIEEVS